MLPSDAILVRVSRILPFESTDSKQPDPVHAKVFDGVLFVSQELLETLKRLPSSEEARRMRHGSCSADTCAVCRAKSMMPKGWVYP